MLNDSMHCWDLMYKHCWDLVYKHDKLAQKETLDRIRCYPPNSAYVTINPPNDGKEVFKDAYVRT